MKKRISFIDIIETLAMLLVIFYHINIQNINILTNPSAVTYTGYAFRGMCTMGVPLFFMANGYLLFKGSFDLKKHILKTIKIIILTLVWGAITLVLFMPINHEWLSLKEFVVALLKWRQGWIDYLWFMGCLVCIYCIFPVLKYAYNYDYKILRVIAVLCMTFVFGNSLLNNLATIFLGCTGHITAPVNFNFFNIFNPLSQKYAFTFAYFCFGGVMIEVLEKIKNEIKRNTVIMVLGIIGSMTVLVLYGIYVSKLTGQLWDAVWNGYGTVSTLISSVLMFLILSRINKNIFMCESISRNTLGIYFIHWILCRIVKIFSRYLTIYPNVILLITIIIAVAIIFLSLNIVYILKKIKITRYLVT